MAIGRDCAGERKGKSKKYLDPNHLADLKKSGLSDKTIEQSGIRTVRPADVAKVLGFNVPGLVSMYEIPYGSGFSRFRAFYGKEKGKGPKYLQRKDTGNRLYSSAQGKSMLQDLSQPLYLTEGEKKALKLVQEGFCCIGLSGLWGWSAGNKKLLSDFDLLALDGRIVYIVPDSDWLQANKHGYKKNLQQAVYALAGKLRERGARVSILMLPPGEKGRKTGLDDYLCAHSIKELQALPSQEILPLAETIATATEADIPEILEQLKMVESETERSFHIQKFADKLKLSKRAIQNEIKALSGNSATDESETVLSARLEGLVNLVLNENGEVVYLFRNDDTLRILPNKEIDDVIYLPPEKAQLPFKLPRAAEVIKWYEVDDDQKLFEDIITYLKRFSYLEDAQWLIVACVVFLSYLQDHPDIRYSPILLFYAIPERGKSRTGEAVTYLTYRGICLVDLREATLFRFSENLNAALFFDVKNLRKKAEKNGSEDILLSRFEKGKKIARVQFPEEGAFKDTVYYDIYGPTIIATNDPVHHILGTRCIPIIMPNKPGNYENPGADKAQELMERITAWRARVMNKPLPEIKPVKGLVSRLWDISKPLLQICQLVHPSRVNGLNNALQQVAEQKIEDKRDGIEGRILIALAEISPLKTPHWTIQTSDVLRRLNEDTPEKWKTTPQSLGKKLKAMGFRTNIVMGYSRIHLNRKDFDKLVEEFKITVTPTPVKNNEL